MNKLNSMIWHDSNCFESYLLLGCHNCKKPLVTFLLNFTPNFSLSLLKSLLLAPSSSLKLYFALILMQLVNSFYLCIVCLIIINLSINFEFMPTLKNLRGLVGLVVTLHSLGLLMGKFYLT